MTVARRRIVLPRLDAGRAHLLALRRSGDEAELAGSPVLVPARTLPGALAGVDPRFLAAALERLRVARPEREATA